MAYVEEALVYGRSSGSKIRYVMIFHTSISKQFTSTFFQDIYPWAGEKRQDG